MELLLYRHAVRCSSYVTFYFTVTTLERNVPMSARNPSTSAMVKTYALLVLCIVFFSAIVKPFHHEL